MADAEHLRASDADREAAVARLRTAAADGRLDTDELENRVSSAYAARTHGDLAAVTTDLPAAPASPARREPVLRSERVRRRAAGFVTTNAICIAIWAATGADGGFWPVWVLLGTSIGLIGPLVHGAFGVPEPQRDRDRDRGRTRRRGSDHPQR